MEKGNKQIMEECFLRSTACLPTQVHALHHTPEEYLETLKFLMGSGTFTAVPSSVKSKVFAALHLTSKHKALGDILSRCEVTEIASGLTLLDRPRQAKQLRQKIQKIEDAHPELVEEDRTEEPKKKKRKNRRQVDEYRRQLRQLEADLEPKVPYLDDSAVQEMIQSSSVSGALARKIRKWAGGLKSDFLEFIMLAMPNTAWKKVADLVHFSPSDFAVPYFLADIHGEAIPSDSFVAKMRELVEAGAHTVEKYMALAESHPQQVYLAFPFIRTQPALMRHEIVEDLVEHMPLEKAIWYFEELFRVSKKTESIVMERVKREDVLVRKSKETSYAKLLERILAFRRMGRYKLAESFLPVASARLEELKGFWTGQKRGNKKVVVFGDASYSMQSAIEAATIFSSEVSTCFDGELSFFSTDMIPSPHARPKNVEQTLEVCNKIRATASTSLAAALWPYYERKEVVDMIVMVTDEEENTNYHGFNFAELLRKYKEEVHAEVALVIVCVGLGDKAFRQQLAVNQIVAKTVTIDGARPDLTKFDALLGQIAVICSEQEEVNDPMEETEEGDAGGFVVV